MEDYFSRGGLVSVSGFYKAIDSFVEQQNVATTIGGTTANVSEPVNGGAGSIYGLELEFQYAFDGNWLWSGLKGFGVAANYTRSRVLLPAVDLVLDQRAHPGRVAERAHGDRLL